ncbi:hypothetical protein CR492_12380 [Methylocella silvestris]|uniref:Uncharacterized protein n=2 Tax=Methylocella silvestris TaxID=199596 RepID=A0A2J7TG12_METSI|nr:hypothetical protein CR492_12380 [Methylocella silvestris]
MVCSESPHNTAFNVVGCDKRIVIVTNAGAAYGVGVLPAGSDAAPLIGVVPPLSSVRFTCVSSGSWLSEPVLS